MYRRKRKSNLPVFVNNEPALVKTQPPPPKVNNIFEEYLKKAGFVLGEKNNANELEVDQAVFVRDLAKIIKADDNFPDVSNFIKGFEKMLDDEVRFKWSLLPTVTSPSCKSARNACQDSLMHLLLGIEILQEKISKVLLEKLVELSVCDENEIFNPSEGKSLACMILSQFRWLNCLVNSAGLTEKLLELIKATPTEVQRDIIILLPDIIRESEHSKVASELCEILLETQELSVAILDTLSNLNIETEILTHVRKQVLKTLSSAATEDLPAVIRFVLLNLHADEIVDTIQQMRSNLDFTPAFDPVSSSTPIEPAKKTDDVSSQILNAIKLSLKFQKSLCNTWLKVLELVKSPETYKSFDFMIFLVLHPLGYQRKVENLVRSKIKAGDINENLLNVTFRCHHQLLKEYLPTLLALAEILLRSIEPVVSMYGCSLYIKSFIWFDTYCKQEVVGSLVTHVGNGSSNEINAALDTLLSLVKLHTPKIVPFALFIKNLLENFDNLTLNQIKKVHAMLSILSYQGGREGSMLQDDMHIIIRKQLTNGNLRYRKMGVIGALMTVKTACHKSMEPSSPVPSCLESTTSSHSKAISLLEITLKSIINSEEALALFYDELSRIIVEGRFEKKIEEWIDEYLLSDFQDGYIIDCESISSTVKTNGTGLKFGLDEIDNPIALNLCGIIKEYKGIGKNKKILLNSSLHESMGFHTQSSQRASVSINVNKVLSVLSKVPSSSLENKASSSKSKALSPLVLASHFRLLRVRKQSEDGCLDEIDALLGCPILLPELQYQKFASLFTEDKYFVLDCLFYCINWIRENLNAFAPTNDKDAKFNVCCRLQLVVELQDLLCKYIQEVNGYVPPLANFDCEETQISQLKLVQKSSKKKQPKKAKKGKKCDKMSSQMQSKIIESDEDDDNEEETSNENTNPLKSVITALQPFFRELDVDVFVLLELGVTFKKPCNILSGEKSRELSLYPQELYFLLDDLAGKLKHYLLSSSVFSRLKPSQKRIGYSNLEVLSTQEVATFCIRLFPALCNIAEECHKYFCNITSESDGIIDSLVLLSDESKLISQCFQLVFKVMNYILSWKGFLSNENIDLLRKAMSFFTGTTAKSSFSSIQSLVEQAVNYLCKFKDSVVSLQCATSLVQLMETLLIYSKEKELKKRAVDISKEFLKRSWVELVKKQMKPSEANRYIQLILEAYLRHNDSVLESLELLSSKAIAELSAEENEVTFKTLTKASLSCYYKIIMSNLVEYMKLYYMKSPANPEGELVNWSLSIKIFHALINLIKTYDLRSIIFPALKYGRQFVDLFLKYGMPLLDKSFLNSKDDILFLLRTLQMSTRYMQHICSHSKVLKDVNLTGQVPFVKKTLECFVYRVKVMLAVNKCTEAFWIGNLKNRDLKGTEILSQTVNSDEEEEEEQEQDSEVVKDSESESVVESNKDEQSDIELPESDE